MKVTCSCEAFRYWGYAYINSEMDTKHGEKETRKPKKQNVELKGSICKHLEAVLINLAFHFNYYCFLIEQVDLIKKKVLKIIYIKIMIY